MVFIDKISIYYKVIKIAKTSYGVSKTTVRLFSSNGLPVKNKTHNAVILLEREGFEAIRLMCKTRDVLFIDNEGNVKNKLGLVF